MAWPIPKTAVGSVWLAISVNPLGVPRVTLVLPSELQQTARTRLLGFTVIAGSVKLADVPEVPPVGVPSRAAEVATPENSVTTMLPLAVKVAGQVAVILKDDPVIVTGA